MTLIPSSSLEFAVYFFFNFRVIINQINYNMLISDSSCMNIFLYKLILLFYIEFLKLMFIFSFKHEKLSLPIYHHTQ